MTTKSNVIYKNRIYFIGTYNFYSILIDQELYEMIAIRENLKTQDLTEYRTHFESHNFNINRDVSENS